MSSIRHFFNKLGSLPDPNTWVGGTYISTLANLDSYTDFIDVYTEVENFQVDGSGNTSYYADVSYQLYRSFLNNNTTCRYLICPDNVILRTNSFNGLVNTHLEFLYLIGQTEILNSSLQNCAYLKHLNLENVTNIVGIVLSNSKQKKLSLKSLTTLGGASRLGINLSEIQRVDIKALTSITNDDYGYTDHFTGSNTNAKIYYNSALGVTDRGAWAWIYHAGTGYVIGDTIVINGLTYTAVSGSPTTDGEFEGSVGSWTTSRTNLINAINSDTRTGTYGKVYAYPSRLNFTINLRNDTAGVGGETYIDSSGVSSVIYFDKSGDYFTGGYDVHMMLQYLRDELSWTLVECSAPITVNAPTSLSASNQTTTSVDLSFTAPTANANGTDAYEVWVDDGTVYRKWFEYDEISASGDTLDLTDVYNDVGTISGTKIKIRTIDGQMNFSDFSNEITLP